MTKPSFSVRDLTVSAVIAGLYAALTLLFAAISYGPFQFRVSEALTILPVLFPQAIPGLTLGCLLANVLGGASVWDVVFGTLATLLAAILTRKCKKNIWLAAAAPVVCNAVIVGLVLHFTLADALLWPTIGSVGLGEAVVVYALGIPLFSGLRQVPLLTRIGERTVGKNCDEEVKKNGSGNVTSLDASSLNKTDAED